ncbi:MAG: UDP-N-acetylmuramate--L-alanine ligase [Oscillospiraceae bacterium]|jgi:UDP-N-acetylmuramate--alanine ligase|nr:UDP-N-acetylmuramate--L-alanine ligase [Oscillospiraceae bacterium]
MPAITEETLKQYHNLHFIGVGGSGMFPLVQILLAQGHSISGSDNNPGDTIDQERSLGVHVTIGHDAANVQTADAVVYSAAIMQDNIELVTARERGIPIIERSEMLGLLTRRYNNCVCVSGTHGKTTTTSMITYLMLASNLDPSAVIGGKVNAIGGSGRAGLSQNMVVEACEFVDTFLHLSPDIAVILNVDADHLDYFKTLDNIIRSFHRFCELTSRTIIYNGDDENSRKAVEGIDKQLISFGLSDKNDYYAENITWKNGSRCDFDLIKNEKKVTALQLNIPGHHNVLNAIAACAAALEAGAKPEKLAEGLSAFTGAHRRFEILGTINGVTIADDYAHHPAELAATLKAAKALDYNSVWAVFQPFTFSRTAMLLDDFAKVLPIADHVVMSAIMGGREVNTYGITTEDLAVKIPGSVWFETFEEIAEYVLTNAQEGDLVLTLGCGDVYKCAKLMLGVAVPK